MLESGLSVQAALPGSLMQRNRKSSKRVSKPVGLRPRRLRAMKKRSVMIVGAGRLGTAMGLAWLGLAHICRIASMVALWC